MRFDVWPPKKGGKALLKLIIKIKMKIIIKMKRLKVRVCI